VSKEVADSFVEALRKLEEDRDVEALVEIHTEDCEVGNVSVSQTFRGHDGLREFWTEYRKTFGEMRSTFRNVFATEEGAALEWTTQGPRTWCGDGAEEYSLGSHLCSSLQ
jgi:ketosteroid isomerase-like protein